MYIGLQFQFVSSYYKTHRFLKVLPCLLIWWLRFFSNLVLNPIASIRKYPVFLVTYFQGPRRREGGQEGPWHPLFLSKQHFCIWYFYQHSVGYHGISFNIVLIITDYSNIGNLYQNLGLRAVAATGARGFLPLQIFQPVYGTIYIKRLRVKNVSTFFSFLTWLHKCAGYIIYCSY